MVLCNNVFKATLNVLDSVGHLHGGPIQKGWKRGMWQVCLYVCRLIPKNGDMLSYFSQTGWFSVSLCRHRCFWKKSSQQLWQKLWTSFLIRLCRSWSGKEASSTLATMQVLLIHILLKAEGKKESKDACLLLFLPIEPCSGSEWLFLAPLACEACI